MTNVITLGGQPVKAGGGQDFAIGALEGGATAVQAVRIAIKRSEMAGLGVDSVRF